MPGIKARIDGDKKIRQYLKTLKTGGIKAALTAMAEYFLGTSGRGLRHYPPPRPSKYVRTYTLRGGWQATVPQGNKLYIRNAVPYAVYVQGDPPAYHMKRRGWRSWKDIISSNMAGALRAAGAAVKKYLGAK